MVVLILRGRKRIIDRLQAWRLVKLSDQIAKSYGTSERVGRYAPIRKDQENDVIQIHTDGKIPQGEEIRRSDRNTNNPNRYGTVPYPKIWIGLIRNFRINRIKDSYRSNAEQSEGHPSAGEDSEARRFHARRHNTARNLSHVESERERRERDGGNVTRFI